MPTTVESSTICDPGDGGQEIPSCEDSLAKMKLNCVISHQVGWYTVLVFIINIIGDSVIPESNQPVQHPTSIKKEEYWKDC